MCRRICGTIALINARIQMHVIIIVDIVNVVKVVVNVIVVACFRFGYIDRLGE